jgi:superfamily II DNA helicase RecQ
MAAIVDDVIRQRIKILFVSPERLTSPSFRRLFNPKWNPQTKQMERRFPDISLLCVDEAHCMSQWAHNFRPCFLRFKSLLNLLAPKSVLAITATAGPRVLDDICDTLGIDRSERIEGGDTNDDSTDSNEGIRIINKSRDNIDVACQFVAHSDERLSIVSGIFVIKECSNVVSNIMHLARKHSQNEIKEKRVK